MATRVLGSSYLYGATSMFYYTVTTNNDTTYTLTLYGGSNYNVATEMGASMSVSCTMSGTGQTAKTGSKTYASGATISKGDQTLISSYTWSWTKTHSSQTITVSSVYKSGNGTVTHPTASKSFTIGARTSYAVQFNANGGNGAPSNQTKWYGEALTITSTAPTKSGYTFIGWATSEANAASGVVAYESGDTYSTNAALTLYAVWELAYTKPIINNLSIERCLSDGTPDDEGLYALVKFDWEIFSSSAARYYGGDTYPYASNAVDTCTVTVGSVTVTPTLTGTSGSETILVGSGNFGVDTEYAATVEITDSQTIASQHTATATGALPTSSFPMDVNAAGTAVALLRPAPDNDTGVFIGDDLDVSGVVEAENLPGIIKMFAGTFAPTGWLLCNGAEVLIADYPALHDVIQNTYGTPSDSDHFVLPDFRGRTPIGSGIGTAGGATTHALGSAGGDERMQSHSHGNTIKATTPKFTHSISSSNSNVNLLGSGAEQSYGKAGSGGSTYPYKRLSIADHAATACTMSGSVSSEGSGAAGNMPPFLTVNYIISTGGISRWSDSAGLPIVRDVTYNGQSIVNNEVAHITMPYGTLVEMSADLTLTTSYQKTALINFSGDGCFLSSNGIEIEADGIYDITASLYVAASYQADDIVHAGIYVNDTHIQHGQYRTHTANPYSIMIVPRVLYHLVAGDVVNLRAYNQSGARGIIGRVNTGLRLNRIS